MTPQLTALTSAGFTVTSYTTAASLDADDATLPGSRVRAALGARAQVAPPALPSVSAWDAECAPPVTPTPMASAELDSLLSLPADRLALEAQALQRVLAALMAGWRAKAPLLTRTTPYLRSPYLTLPHFH